MVNGIAPDYLSSMVPRSIGQSTNYYLRNENNLSDISSRTTLYARSFMPSTINDWNELPLHVRNMNSLSSFKAYLSSSKPKSNKLYYYGKRWLQVIHTRLRTGCSTLFHHLFMKNIVDSPLCRCGSVETTQHFFFDCSRYDNIRPNLINEVSRVTTPSLDVLLYGDDTKDFTANSVIFQAVQRFIECSKRFER